MQENGRELIQALHRQAIERFRSQPLPRVEPLAISYTDLPEAQPDDVLCREWNTYRREVQRLLSEGREGQFILIKGEAIIGIWPTEEEAESVAREKFLLQTCLIHQIRSREPLLRGTYPNPPMPQLIFPVSKDGLFVDALIGLDGTTTAALFSSKQPIPLPVRARAAIDTGSDVSVVGRTILQQLGVPVQHQATTQTVAGSVSVNLYNVSVGITDFANPGAPELVEPTVLVMELPQAVPGIEVLIGLDVLLGCRFLLDGPGRQFMLDF